MGAYTTWLKNKGLQPEETPATTGSYSYWLANKQIRARKAQEAEDIQRQKALVKQQEDAIKNRKLSAWERVISLLSSTETGNASYELTKRIKQGKFNPLAEAASILPFTEHIKGVRDNSFLGRYKADLYEGIKDAAVGKDTNQSLKNKKTYSNVLDELGVKNKYAKAIGGFAGDVLGDPTTYISFGTLGGAKAATTKGTKVVLTKAGKEAVDAGVNRAVRKLGEKSLKSAGKKVTAKTAAARGMELAQKAAPKSKTFAGNYLDLLRATEVDKLVKARNAAKYIDKGGINLGLPFSQKYAKTVVGTDQLAKVGLGKVGQYGLIKGGASSLLDVGEKFPGGKYIQGGRKGIRELFDKKYASGLEAAGFGGFWDEQRKFTTMTKSESSKQVTDFLESARKMVKHNRKEYGGVEGLGKAIYDYVEGVPGAKLNDEVAGWVDDVLNPTVKRLAKDEKQAGLLREEILRYLPHIRSKKMTADQASKVFGARELKVMDDLPYDKQSEAVSKFVPVDGGEAFIGTALDKNMVEVPYMKGLTADLTEGETNWLMDAVKALKQRGIVVEFKPVPNLTKKKGVIEFGHLVPSSNKIVIAGGNPVGGLEQVLSTLSHEGTHGIHGKLGAKKVLYDAFKKSKSPHVSEVLADTVRKEWEGILDSTKVLPSSKRLGLQYRKLKPAEKAAATKAIKRANKEIDDLLVKLKALAKEKSALTRAAKKAGAPGDTVLRARLDKKSAAIRKQIAKLKKEVYENGMRKKGIDPRIVDEHTLEYYLKKPTELLSRAVEVYRQDPALARKLFPQTTNMIESGKISTMTGKLASQPDEALGRVIKAGRTFRDDTGKMWYDEGRAALSEANEYFAKKPGVPDEVFNPNLFETMPRRIADSVRARKSQEFFDFVKSKYGLPIERKLKTKVWDPKARKYITKQAVDNVVKDGVTYRTSSLKGLKGVLLPEPILKDFEKTYKVMTNPDAATEFGRSIDTIMKYWKLSVTSVFPAFHVRNVIGAMFNNWLAGVSPTMYPKATQVWRTQRDGVERFITVGGRKVSTVDILKQAMDNGAIGTSGYLDIAKNELARYSGNAVARNLNYLTQGAKYSPMAATENVETLVRLPLFLNELEKGTDAYGAANAVLKFHFDYSPENATSFERGMKRVIPFYTWTRNNIPLQFEMMSKQPGKYALWAKIFQGQDREKEWTQRENMPDWMRNTPTMKVPWNQDKRFQLDLPMADLARLGTKEMASMVSPLIKAPIEVVTNRNIFTGKEITNPNLNRQYNKARIGDNLFLIPNSMIPDQLKKVLGMEQDENGSWQMDARLQYGIQSFGSRTLSTTKTLFDDSKGWKEKTLKLGAGIPVYDTKLYAASTVKQRLIKNMSPEQQAVYNSIHTKMEGETPMLYTARKAATYIDYPEFFMADKIYQKALAKGMGTTVNPIYDLTWPQAKMIYAQQAKGDKWNEDELQEMNWYNAFKKSQTKYYEELDKKNKEQGKTTIASENDPFYIKPSNLVASKLDAKQYTDADVQQYFQDVENANNIKRQVLGLITPDRYNAEKDMIQEGKEKFKEATGKSLVYMQAIRMAGLGYESFFEKHPELDPLQGATPKAGQFRYSYKRKRKGKVVKMPKAIQTKKVDKAKVIKLANSKVKLPNPKNVKQWM